MEIYYHSNVERLDGYILSNISTSSYFSLVSICQTLYVLLRPYLRLWGSDFLLVHSKLLISISTSNILFHEKITGYCLSMYSNPQDTRKALCETNELMPNNHSLEY